MTVRPAKTQISLRSHWADEKIHAIMISDDDNNSDTESTSGFFYKLTRSELDDVIKIIKALPLTKAPSYDKFTYEHIISGGEIIKECIFRLFDSIINSENVSQRFKSGLIITLHIVSGKSLLNPDNYRAISL